MLPKLRIYFVLAKSGVSISGPHVGCIPIFLEDSQMDVWFTPVLVPSVCINLPVAPPLLSLPHLNIISFGCPLSRTAFTFSATSAIASSHDILFHCPLPRGPVLRKGYKILSGSYTCHIPELPFAHNLPLVETCFGLPSSFTILPSSINARPPSSILQTRHVYGTELRSASVEGEKSAPPNSVSMAFKAFGATAKAAPDAAPSFKKFRLVSLAIVSLLEKVCYDVCCYL